MQIHAFMYFEWKRDLDTAVNMWGQKYDSIAKFFQLCLGRNNNNEKDRPWPSHLWKKQIPLWHELNEILRTGLHLAPNCSFWSGRYRRMYWVLIWSSCVKIQKHPVVYKAINVGLKLHSNGISMYGTSIFFLDKMQRGGSLSVTP